MKLHFLRRAYHQWFKHDLQKIKEQLDGDADFPISRLKPIYKERSDSGGTLSGHYFHQDLLVARRIHANQPEKHVDVGSRTDGFVAHLAVFREVEIFDIRSNQSKVKNITSVQADFMQLSEHLYDYTDSISSLHAIEHFGLGRYGDTIDAYGHLKGLDSLRKALKPGGKFYFSAPMGPQRIEFNAHRIFSLSYLLSVFSKHYQLDQFSYVDDAGDLHENTPLSDEKISNNYGCDHGCAILEMTKL